MPKISALTSLAQASVDTAADVLPIVDATAPATTKKVTVQAMVNAGLAAAAPQGGIFALTGALTVSGQASFTDGSAAAPSVKIGDEQNGLYSDGAGSLSFATAGKRVVRFGTVGATGNYLRLDANNTPLITAVAGATNADIGIASAGTGSVLFATNGSINNLQARVSHVASAVNYWDFTGAPTGSGIRVDATGSDSGVNGFFVAKGSGVWNFCTSGSSSNRQFQIGHIASAVNYGQFTGNSAGGYPSLRAAGSDTNIGFDFATQGVAPFRFYTSAFGAEQLRILSTSSAVNYVAITGSATGNAVTASAAGSDSNIDFAITPKGTGNVRFGTHSAIAAETVTGYITIKDSAGNTRKLAVLS